jgi:hypothetical protein
MVELVRAGASGRSGGLNSLCGIDLRVSQGGGGECNKDGSAGKRRVLAQRD